MFKMPHVNKKSREKQKLGLKNNMEGLGKLFRKKCDPKIEKTLKNRSEIAACEQKTTRKRIFCSNTVF